jgi:hypothetical protein
VAAVFSPEISSHKGVHRAGRAAEEGSVTVGVAVWLGTIAFAAMMLERGGAGAVGLAGLLIAPPAVLSFLFSGARRALISLYRTLREGLAGFGSPNRTAASSSESADVPARVSTMPVVVKTSSSKAAMRDLLRDVFLGGKAGPQTKRLEPDYEFGHVLRIGESAAFAPKPLEFAEWTRFLSRLDSRGAPEDAARLEELASSPLEAVLERLGRNENSTAESVARALAWESIRAMEQTQSRPRELVALRNLYRLTGVLHALGDSLFLRSERPDLEKELLTAEQRASYQARDLEWLLQASFHMGYSRAEDEAARKQAVADLNDGVVPEYRRARKEALEHSLSFKALDRLLRGEGDIVIQISPNMLSAGAELSPSETTALRMIVNLAHRLRSSPELLDGRKIRFVVHGEGVWRQTDFVSALAGRVAEGGEILSVFRERQFDIDALRPGDLPSVRGRPRLLTKDGRVSVSRLRSFLGLRGNEKLNVFILNEAQWQNDAKEGLVTLILMLAGDVVKNITGQIEEAIQAELFLRIQA